MGIGFTGDRVWLGRELQALPSLFCLYLTLRTGTGNSYSGQLIFRRYGGKEEDEALLQGPEGAAEMNMSIGPNKADNVGKRSSCSTGILSGSRY